MVDFFDSLLDILKPLWYNDTPERETGSDSLTTPLQKETMNFETHTTNAKIQGLSIQVGELFADLYRDVTKQDEALDALESYKSLRRCLPREDVYTDSRHLGATAAHTATQGR